MPKSRKPKLGRIFRKFNRDPETGGKVFHRTWTIRFRGKDYATGTDNSGEAEQQLVKLISDASQERKKEEKGAEGIIVNDLLEMVLTDYRREDKSNIQSVEAHIRLHLAPVFGKRKALDLVKDDIEKYKDARVAEGAAKATINRELAALRRGFSLAVEAGKLKFIPPIRKFTEDNVRTGFINREQYLKLYGEMPDYLKPVLCVGYHIGDRRGEVLTMRTSQVSLRHKEIDLEPGSTKNKQGRTAPIYGDMLPVLTEWLASSKREHPDCDYVFHKNGQPMQSFYKTWNPACERAGLKGLLFHDLRRSAVRNLTRAGVPRPIARKITGHKTDSVYDRYDIVDSSDIKLAGAMLDKFVEGQT